MSTCSWCKDLPKRERAKEKLREKKEDHAHKERMKDKEDRINAAALQVLANKMAKAKRLEGVEINLGKLNIGEHNKGRAKELQYGGKIGGEASKALVTGDFFTILVCICIEFSFRILLTFFVYFLIC